MDVFIVDNAPDGALSRKIRVALIRALQGALKETPDFKKGNLLYRAATAFTYLVGRCFPMERINLSSSMYRFNYKFLEILFDSVYRGDFMSSGGYIPLDGHIRSEIVDAEPADRQMEIDVDPVKLHYLEQLVLEAKRIGTEVVLVVSPSWHGGDYAPEVFDSVREIAEKYGARFFTYLDSPICDDADCFEDSSHLNDDGARLFTASLILQLI